MTVPNSPTATVIFHTKGDETLNFDLAGGPFTIRDLTAINANTAGWTFRNGGLVFAPGATLSFDTRSPTLPNLDNGFFALSGPSTLRVALGSTFRTSSSASLTGTGSLLLEGGGTAIIGGANTFNGVTTINATTLQVGDGGTSGSLGTGAIVNNGVLRLFRSDNLLMSQDISGTGSLEKRGGGTLTLTGANSYSGATTISQGVLQIGAGGTTGSLGGGSIFIAAAGALAVNRSDSVTIAGAISGAGTLNQIGAGTTILSGNGAAFTGTTNVNAGTLQLGAGGTTGWLGGGSIFIAAAGALVLNRSDAVTLANTITGSGTLNQVGTGTTNLAGNAGAFTGTTNVNAGTLQVTGSLGGSLNVNGGTLRLGSGGTTGSLGGGPIFIAAAGALAFNRSDAVTLANTITGSGALNQIGTGTTTFAGNASAFTGTTNVNAGTLLVTGSLGGAVNVNGGALQIGSGGTTGAIGNGAVAINAGAALTVNRSDLVTISGSISGAGTLNQIGTGTTTLSGNGAAFAGTTNVNAGTLQVTGSLGGSVNINAGTLQLGAGGTTGSLGGGSIFIAAAGALAVNRSDAVTIAGAISGSGTLDQLGAGTTILSGNAGAFTGTTNVNAGTLQVTGSLGGAVNVNGGMLQIGSGGTTGSIGNGAVTLNAASSLGVNRSDAVTLSNSISGSGALNQLGTGTTTLAGNAGAFTGTTNLNAGTLRVTGSLGGSVNVNGGALQLGAGGTTGSLGGGSVFIAASGALALNRSDAVTLSNTITGSGTLNQLGTGTTTFAGNGAAFTGTTNVNAGTLQVTGSLGGSVNVNSGILQLGSGGTTGSLGGGSIFIAAAGALAFNRSDAVTLANTITGAGALNQLGTGTTNLAGNASAFTGTTNVAAGTLQVTGSLGGAVNVNGGTLQIGSGGTAGSIGNGAVTINAGSTLALNRSDAVTLSNTITGSSALNQIGTGTTTLAGNAGAFAGTTNVNAGTLQVTGSLGGSVNVNAATLQLGTGGTTGSLGGGSIFIAASGGLAFNRSDAVTLANTISGAGTLNQIGTGTTTLSGNAGAFTGTTNVNAGTLQVTGSLGGSVNINAGTLQLGSGGTTGALGGGSVFIAAAGTLALNRSDALTLANTITGSGTLNQIGMGTTTFAGNGAAFIGATNVNAGALLVTGSLGGAVNVNAGGLLGGSGTVGSIGRTTWVNAGGGLAPGLSPGTLNVAGNLVLGAGSNSNFELNRSLEVGGTNDLVNVAGDLSIANGAVLNVGPAVSGYYRIFNVSGAVIAGGGPNLGFTTINAAPGVTLAAVQQTTATPNQVNLFLSNGGQMVQAFDGADLTGMSPGGEGGPGTWGVSTNWAQLPNGVLNNPWLGHVGVFGGVRGGAVNLLGQQGVQGLQFTVDGYSFAGGAIHALGNAVTGGNAAASFLNVDAGVSTTIASTISSGAGIGLDKLGPGRLVLTGANSFAGLTDIQSGVVNVGNDAALGAADGSAATGTRVRRGQRSSSKVASLSRAKRSY